MTADGTVVTRLAPTPSGFLHLGNAVNFQLVAWLAEQSGGRTVLRIDDMDAIRYRRAYVEDIFRVLEWLEIHWQAGPATVAEFESGFSMRSRTDYYRSELERMRASDLETYACRCSRRQLQSAATLACPSGCRTRGLDLTTGVTALRVHVETGTTVDVSGRAVRIDETSGDFVLWRREGLPAYHLASVIEDRDLGVTHIVRGEDLVESTAAQLHIAPALGAMSVAGATYVHHRLLTDSRGRKLSKSRLDAGPIDRTPAARDEVRRRAAEIGRPLGIGPER